MELGGLLANLGLGFSVAVSLQNLLWCLAGAVIGTCIGVLPGVGPVATMALLLPVTYLLPAEGALIMLAGIYYGAQYGGSTTAILVNLPGEFELGGNHASTATRWRARAAPARRSPSPLSDPSLPAAWRPLPSRWRHRR